METFFQAITQIGILPAIIGFLLWDYSRKLAALELEVQKIQSTLDNHCAVGNKILEKMEKIEEKL